MTFLFEQFIFLLTLLLLGFLPGWLLLSLLFHRKNPFALIEKVFLTIPLSFGLVTFLILALGKLSIPLTQRSTMLSLVVLCALLHGLRALFHSPVKKIGDKHTGTLFTFSRRKTALIALLFLLTLTIKGSYLVNTIFPTSTDLGHHLFWVEKTVHTGVLPIYEEKNITTNDDGRYILSAPEPIADFIIGEHLFLIATALLSDQKIISAFPSLALLLFNIGMIGLLFILGTRLSHALIRSFLGSSQRGIELAQRCAITVLLFAGPLYALSGPQAKFVSGGVIGNILGNLLIPTVLYFLYRAYVRKDAWMLFAGLFATVTLIYTHHLSAFVLLFILFFTFIFSLAINLHTIKDYATHWLSLVTKPQIIALLVAVCILLFFVHTPSYLNSSDVGSTLGDPSKQTRTGLTFMQLIYTVGEARFAFAIVGALLLLVIARKAFATEKRHAIFFALSILVGWFVSTTVMTLAPQMLHINIISSRIANYTISAYTLLAGIGLALTFALVYNKYKDRATIPFPLFTTSFFILLSFVFVSGMYDNKQAYRATPNTIEATQTFHSSTYLGAVLNEEDTLLKDHNFIIADAFMKLSFLRDYRYPLSRGFFKRYESSSREQCTLLMIAQPNTEEAQRCFDDLGVNVVLVNTEEDAGQFLRSDNFTRFYQSDILSAFIKK